MKRELNAFYGAEENSGAEMEYEWSHGGEGDVALKIRPGKESLSGFWHFSRLKIGFPFRAARKWDILIPSLLFDELLFEANHTLFWFICNLPRSIMQPLCLPFLHIAGLCVRRFNWKVITIWIVLPTDCHFWSAIINPFRIQQQHTP